MKKVSLFCDGSSLGNPGAGGWCGILRYKNIEKVIRGNAQHSTNNQMELKAVIESLKLLNQPCEITLYSDSQYVCGAINTWLKTWVKKDFKNIKNPSMWKDYLEISKPHKIQAIWIKGHSGHLENERCDKIAKEEANKVKGL